METQTKLLQKKNQSRYIEGTKEGSWREFWQMLKKEIQTAKNMIFKIELNFKEDKMEQEEIRETEKSQEPQEDLDLTEEQEPTQTGFELSDFDWGLESLDFGFESLTL